MKMTQKLKMILAVLTVVTATTVPTQNARALTIIDLFMHNDNLCTGVNALGFLLLLPICILDEKSPQTIETFSQMAENGYDVDKIVVGKLAIDSALAASHQTIDYSDVRTRADLSKKFKSIDAQAPEEYINFLADQLQLQ